MEDIHEHFTELSCLRDALDFEINITILKICLVLYNQTRIMIMHGILTEEKNIRALILTCCFICKAEHRTTSCYF